MLVADGHLERRGVLVVVGRGRVRRGVAVRGIRTVEAAEGRQVHQNLQELRH